MSTAPKSVQRFAKSAAQSMDGRLERMAATANAIANETGDQRWQTLALALLGARPLVRPLIVGEASKAPATN